MRRSLVVVAGLLVLSSSALACGGDEEVAAPTRTQTAPPAPTAGPDTGTDATAGAAGAPTATAPAAPPPPATSPEDRPGGAGDEEPIRVPAAFTAGDRLSPQTVEVPAFLGLELSLASADGRAHTLTLRARGRSYRLRVEGGGRASRTVPGLPPGRYPVLLDGERAGTLVAGAEPGP